MPEQLQAKHDAHHALLDAQLDILKDVARDARYAAGILRPIGGPPTPGAL